MREIKFRAWDENNKTMEWIENLEWQQGWSGPSLKVRGRGATAPPGHYSGPMQFTGLRDNNLKEIYEGDICHTDYFKDNGWNTKAFNENQEVKFEDGAFQLGDFTTLYECTSNHEYALEVIGNIYENPELLENVTVQK